MVGLVALLTLGVQQALPVTPVELPKPVTFEVTGSVVDELGVPVPAADCIIRTQSGRWTDVESDREGRFLVTLKSAGPYKVWARSDKGWSRNPAETDGVQPAKVILNASETRTVEGRVLDNQRKPVPRARVELTALFIPSVPFADVVRTDDEGRYRFENVFTDAKLRLNITARGFATAVSPRTFSAADSQGEFVLDRADQIVRGRVIGFDLKPIEGAIVACVNGGQSRPVQTDAEGRFELTGLVHGPVSLGAWFGNTLGNAFVPDPKHEVVIKMGDQGPLQALLKTMPPTLEPGALAPPLETSPDWINSTPLTLEALKGKIVLLQFWGMWCPPCVEEIPDLVKLHQDMPDVTIIGIHELLATRDKLARFAQQKGMTWPLVMDGTRVDESIATSFTYGIRGFPTLVVIDGEGKVAWVGHSVEGAKTAIEPLLHKI
ncbi:MAG: carboxypeptidase regulatory-like domain-containing protein [bacterium]